MCVWCVWVVQGGLGYQLLPQTVYHSPTPCKDHKDIYSRFGYKSYSWPYCGMITIEYIGLG